MYQTRLLMLNHYLYIKTIVMSLVLGGFFSCNANSQNRLPDCKGNFEGPCYYSGVAKQNGIDVGNRYEGDVRNQDFNGTGTLSYGNGDKYVGQWKDGLRDGQGTFFKSDGTILNGVWKDDTLYQAQKYTNTNPNTTKVRRYPDCNGVFTGPCYFEGTVLRGGKPSIDRYEGDVLNSKWNGIGTFYFLEEGELKGNRYEGSFVNGQKEGKGTYYWANGDQYVGEFKNEKFEGFGTKTYANKNLYIGDWKNNVIEGQGTFTYFVEGDKYAGSWKNNQRHGFGTYTYSNGEKYVGMYQLNKKEGAGTLYRADGSIARQGLWRDGVFVRN